jgi:hypothetical protein
MNRFLAMALAPAVSVFSRLKMVWKIVILSSVLIVPTLLLGNGYRQGMGAQTSFAAAERAGIQDAQPLSRCSLPRSRCAAPTSRPLATILGVPRAPRSRAVRLRRR